jgi:putative pre-16S rRNA nuclease
MTSRVAHPSPLPTRGKQATTGAALRARVLALDYGRRRIGLALSDELRLTARPLATFERTNRRDDLRRLREIIRKHGVKEIVVGHPVRLDGSAGEMAAEAERFAARVEKETGLPVELVDERLTSWEARETLAETKPRPGKERLLDDIAAAIILRDYLERVRARNAEKA